MWTNCKHVKACVQHVSSFQCVGMFKNSRLSRQQMFVWAPNREAHFGFSGVVLCELFWHQKKQNKGEGRQEKGKNQKEMDGNKRTHMLKIDGTSQNIFYKPTKNAQVDVWSMNLKLNQNRTGNRFCRKVHFFLPFLPATHPS